MRTTISVPDQILARAARRAEASGTNRSELFTTAVRRYLDEPDAESLRRDIDAALNLVDRDESTEAAVRAGRRRPVADDPW